MSLQYDYILNFDGAAVPNPGRGGYGFVIREAATGRVVMSEGDVVTLDNKTEVTSNEAEYTALIKGMEKCFSLRLLNVKILGDSELVISQMNGIYRVTAANLLPLYSKAKDMCRRFGALQFQQIPREENAEADRLANRHASANPSNPSQGPGPIAPPANSRRLRPTEGRGQAGRGNSRGRGEGEGAGGRGRGRDRNAAPADDGRVYYGEQWLNYIQASSREDVRFFQSLVNIFSRVPEEYQHLPPIFPPPYAHAGQPSNAEAVAQLERGMASPNLYASLLDDDDEDDDDDAAAAPQPPRANATAGRAGGAGGRGARAGGRGAAAAAGRGAAAGGTSLSASPPAAQNRYLEVRAECGLADAYQREARVCQREKRWADMAQSWTLAYEVLQQLLLRVGDHWIALLLDAEARRLPQNAMLEGRHPRAALKELLDSVQLMAEHTQREKEAVQDKLAQEIERILQQLNPLRQDRDSIKAKMGEERWRNNPSPKHDYSQRMIQLAKEREELESALETLEGLRLPNVGLR